MTVPRKIMAGFGILNVFVIAMAIVGFIVLAPLRSGVTDFSENTLAKLDAVETIAHSSASMSGYALAAIVDLSDVQSAEYQASVEECAAEVRGGLDTLATLEAGDPEDLATVTSLSALFADYDAALGRAFALAAGSDGWGTSQVTSQVMPLGIQLDSAVDAYSQSEQAQATAEGDRLAGSINRMWLVMVIMTCLVIVAGVVLSIAIPRTIKRELRGAVSSIGDSTSEMLAIASQVAAGAAQTAASTNETTATVEEVKQTALLANEKASWVAESSQNVARIAEGGRQAVEDTIAGIERMQGQMALVAETISRLSDQTQAVGEIIATVSDIAEQSNLLSVNASIEAAKAGEHGKGFTVVAQEVKSLAEQSKQAVSQVRTILSEIQRAGSMAVQAAEQSREAIEAGRQQSLESGEAIHQLAESVNEAAQSAVQIAASSRQQLAGMEQISQAIETINQAGNQSVSGTRQVEHEVKQLQALAQRLRRLVDAGATA